MSNNLIMSRFLDDLSDHEILKDRLEWEGYTEIKMKSDGNCQFRALADQIYQTSDCYKRVRQEIVKQLKLHPKPFKGFVDQMEYSEIIYLSLYRRSPLQLRPLKRRFSFRYKEKEEREEEREEKRKEKEEKKIDKLIKNMKEKKNKNKSHDQFDLF